MKPWNYSRNEPEIFYFENFYTEEDWDDMEYSYPNGIVLLSSFKDNLFDKVKNDIRHGDIIDFEGYRGVGSYVVEPVDEECSDYYCWKTIEEFGYGVPPPFSDAPENYYRNTGIFYGYKSTKLVPNSSELFEEVENVQKSSKLQKERSFIIGDSIDISKFPDNYVYLQAKKDETPYWVSMEDLCTLDYYDPSCWELWEERFRMKYPSRAKSARSISSRPLTEDNPQPKKKQKTK